MGRRTVPLDARSILVELERHGVEYVLIGGLAVQAHGHVRTTEDVDLVPAPGALGGLSGALAALGARPAGTTVAPRGWSPLSALTKATGPVGFETDAGAVDVHPEPPGAGGYEALRSRAMVLTLDDLRVPVAGRDDLIAMKRASGRPIDRGDVIALTEAESS